MLRIATHISSIYPTQIRKSFWAGLFLILGMSLLGLSVFGQSSVTIDELDLGKTKEMPYRFAGSDDVFEMVVRNELSVPMKVRMVRSSKFKKGAYQLKEQLPLVLDAGATQTLHFTVDYSKWIGPATEVILEMLPDSLSQPQSQMVYTTRLSFTSAGKIMIWDPQLRALYDKINFQQFNEGGDGYSERRVELRRNGSDNIFCRIELKDDPRGTFKFFWNEDRPLQNRSTFKLDSRGKSLLVRYQPPDGVSRAMDRTRVTLNNVNDPENSLSFWVVGNLVSASENGGGPPLTSVDIPAPGTRPKQEPKVVRNDPNPDRLPPDPQKDVVINTDPVDTDDPEEPEVELPQEYTPDPLSPAEIFKCLTDLQKTDYRLDTALSFFVEDGETKASLDFNFFPLMAECGHRLNLEPGPATMLLPKGNDSLANRSFQLEVDTFIFADTGRIVFAFPPGMMDTLDIRSMEDSAFLVFFDLTPEMDPQVRDSLDMKDFTLASKMEGKVHFKDWTWYWVIGSLIAGLIFLFFFGRYMLNRPLPVHDLRYRTKPKRKKRLHAKELVYSLDRPEVDLLQLDFTDGELEAEVAPPPESAISPFRKFLKKMFLLGKRPDEFQFQAEYYSFRVEPRLDALKHEGLQFRNQEGLMLLGTELTGEILSTDHQDFLITKQEFLYNIYIDPSEIISYTGPKKTFNIPFVVTEEAFEGYKKQKEFIVPLTVLPKERVRS